MLLAQTVSILSMGWEAWFTLGVIALVMGSLMTNRISVDVAMVGGLTILMLADGIARAFQIGQIFDTSSDAIAGFAHPAVLIIGAMFVIAAGLDETGGMRMIAQRVLGRPKTTTGAQLRLMLPVTIMSAFMNTTPVVAVYLPIVADWARKLRISPSKLYLPLSYAAILGGLWTMIGTSSNITVNELFLDYIEHAPADAQSWLNAHGVSAAELKAHQLYWMAFVGVPASLIATLFIVATTRWLLPARKPAIEIADDERKYSVEMMVQAGSPIVGKTIEQAGLRHLPGLFLTEIERNGTLLPAVGPETKLEPEDRLYFAGVVESVVDLRRIRGLVPATDQVEKVGAHRQERQVVEAVVSHNSPLVGRTVRESKFRTTYNAAIIAVARKGQHIRRKIGDIRLQPGDTLLLVAHTGFISAYRNSGDFYLISSIDEAREVRHERGWLAIFILGLLVTLLAVGSRLGLHPIASAFFCAMLMVVSRCVTGTVARKSIRWQVLAVIGAAIGIGQAMDSTHAANAIATTLMDACGGMGPYVVLFVVFILTSVFAQFVTNNGAAVLMFPIVMYSVRSVGWNPEPFVLATIIAAGSNLMTPVAYQTNLMVYGPGGYRFIDFLRIGIPVTLILAIASTVIAPLLFPFGNPVVVGTP